MSETNFSFLYVSVCTFQ